MSNQHNEDTGQAERLARSNSTTPVWWLVFKREFADLWVGGRVLILLILFSLIMSVTSILREVESQLNLIPPAEMIFLTLLGCISFGLFIGLIIGADSISGERERATLETLLLTPTARRQIVIGKFFAALSPWPVTLLLSIPYILVVAQGDEILGQALLLGALLGGVLADQVAEHTIALILALNRKLHRAFNRIRELNFSLNGLEGFDLHGRHFLDDHLRQTFTATNNERLFSMINNNQGYLSTIVRINGTR